MMTVILGKAAGRIGDLRIGNSLVADLKLAVDLEHDQADLAFLVVGGRLVWAASSKGCQRAICGLAIPPRLYE